MTCILFAKRQEVLYACADGRVTCDNDLIWTDDDEKIIVVHDRIAIGGAGAAGICAKVNAHILNTDFEETPDAYDFADLIATYAFEHRGKHESAVWLVGDPGNGPLWVADTGGWTGPIQRASFGIGNGGQLADAYLTDRPINYKTVHDAVNQAARYKTSCGPVHAFYRLTT